MPMRDFIRRFKFHNKSDSDLVVRPKVQKSKAKGSGLRRFGFSRSEITSEVTSDAGPSSSTREAEQPGELAQQLTDVPTVASYGPVAVADNAAIDASATSLTSSEELSFKGETSIINAGPPIGVAVHPVVQDDHLIVPLDKNTASNASSTSSAPRLPDANAVNAGFGERPSNVDASVHISQQGITYNIGRYANVTLLYGSQINQHHEKHGLHAAIRSLRRSYNAEFDMTANTNRGPCTPETRTAILKDLVDWCNSGTLSLYWMDGMAGTGKTTIAYSLCELLTKANLLGASFFCSRSLPDCRNSNTIIPTIAFQLAKKYAPFAEALAKALENDDGILHRGLDVQLRELLIKPWSENKSMLPSHTVVVVVDAVDECDEGHSDFLKAISGHAGKFPFKFMVTSRPEPTVRSVLLSKDSETLSTLILHEVEASLVEEDIARYVESELKKCLPSLSTSDAQQLSKQCGNFFIYAATLCRFIMDKNGNHLERFRLLLSLSASDARKKATQPIDALYVAILQQTFSSTKPRCEIDGIKLVFHTIVCAREPLTRDAIADLLELSAEEPLSTFHASLPEFMLDRSRSGEFYCHPHTSNIEIFKRCLGQMKRGLRQNICCLDGRPSNDTIDPGVIRTHISLSLQYASVYWSEHWASSDHSERQLALSLLNDFLITGTLHWFECLSLTGKLSVAIESLEGLRDTLTEDTNLANITHEYLQFIQHVYDQIEYNAMETYFSALAWIPLHSSLRSDHSSFCEQAPQVLCGLPTTWPRLERSINVHSNTVYSIAISRDGRYIISGSGDNTVRIWNVRSHVEECVLNGHTEEVNSVAISGDGNRAVSGSDDRNVLVWNIATSEVILTLESDSRVGAVAMSSDNKLFASGHEDSTVRVWDATDGHLAYSLQGHTGWVFSVLFTPDNTRLVSGSGDTTARIWNAATGKTEHILRGHSGKVWSVAYSPSGDKIATGSYDNTARLWDRSGEELHVLRAHSAQVRSVAFMPDRKRVITSSDDKTLRVWEVASGEMVHLFTGLSDAIQSVAVFPNGLKIASSSGPTISIWSSRGKDIIDGEEKDEGASMSNMEAGSMALSANGRRILLLPSLRILITATLEEKVILDSDGVEYSCCTLSISGSKVVVAAEKAIKVWELTGDDAVINHFTLQGHTNSINSVSFSHDERQLVSASDDWTARVWDVRTGNQMHTLNHPFLSPVYSASFSHDDTQIVSAARFTVHIWNAQSGEQLHYFDTYARSAAFSPGDQHVITSYGNTIEIYNAKTSQFEQAHEGYRHWTTMSDGSSYALSDDGQWICHSLCFGDQPHRLLWIPSQYQPAMPTSTYFPPFASGPLFTSTPRGVQVCLPRKDGLILL